MKDYQIKRMVDRFLGWRLPEPFRPDAGISFNPEYNVEYSAARGLTPPRHQPIGTNLFDREQAEAMVRYMIEGMLDECVYCDRGERCVMHGKTGFVAGRLGHTDWCSHMVDDKTCNCGASFPADGEGEHG
jgi:protein tyrosine phosphatase (PTP) superfamily phosphohydrolase (DUF442 family)